MKRTILVLLTTLLVLMITSVAGAHKVSREDAVAIGKQENRKMFGDKHWPALTNL